MDLSGSATLAVQKKNKPEDDNVLFLTKDHTSEFQPIVKLPKTEKAVTKKVLSENKSVKPTSTPSIKEALEKLKSPGKDYNNNDINSEEEKSIANEAELNNDAFTLEDLHRYWIKFADNLKHENRRTASYLKNHLPELNENHHIRVNFHNQAQVDDFNQQVKLRLINILKTSLRNDYIEINAIVEESDQNIKPKYYSDTDKLKHMIEKNPSLLKLKDDLNLDFE